MSYNKTIIPGMENINADSQKTASMSMNNSSSFQGTCYPGMKVGGGNFQQPSYDNHKPIMGFFYSVSRTGSGEYWPIYLGLNQIGRSAACSVCLNEASVSENHAEIVVRMMKNPDRVLVSITDSRSTCGTLVNGRSLGFDSTECKSGDIITIGERYELLLIIIDAKSLGLEPKPDFVQVPPMFNQAPHFPNQNFGSQFPQYHNQQPSSQANPNGGTIVMPAQK